MRFELFIAARYLRAKRRQAVVGVITAISIAGVAAGVAALIIALAITTGMRRDLQDRLLGSTSHVELMRTAGRRHSRLAAAGGAAGEAAACRCRLARALRPGLVSRGARSGGLLIKGILPEQERRVTDLLDMVKLGSAQALEPAPPDIQGDTAPLPPIVIGGDLATTLDANVGDTVLVTSPQGELTPLGIVPKFQRFYVAGIFHSGFYQYDSSYGLRAAGRMRSICWASRT